MDRRLVLVVALACYPAAPAESAALDAAMQKQLAERHIPGASIAVVRNREVLLATGYGMASIEKSLPANADTKYQIASATKPFTALAIMVLVEDGKLELDERAAVYLPRLPERYGGVTIRQLLTHTAGVNRDLRTGNTDDFSLAEFWRRLAAQPAAFAPGERWEYSNTGYILLGLIAEAVAQKPFGELLQQRIFKPAGMDHTEYLTRAVDDPRRAVGHESNDGKFAPAPYFSGGFAAGGLTSTVSDLAKWILALESEKLCRRSTLEQMWTAARLANGTPVTFNFRGEPASYGFGWFLTQHRGHKVVTHGGTVSGFSAQIVRYPDDALTVIGATNSKSGPDRIGHAEFLAQVVADHFLPR